jgi:hypothetical protein
LGDHPVAEAAERIMQQTPTIAIGVAAVASGLYWIMRRRQLLAQTTFDVHADDDGAAEVLADAERAQKGEES